jgi:hypothetical protein
MPYAETQAACEALRAEFTTCYRKLAPKAVERLADDWERLVTLKEQSCCLPCMPECSMSMGCRQARAGSSRWLPDGEGAAAFIALKTLKE